MREDSWLGERMGCPAWTVEGGDSVDEVASRGPGFFQAKVPSTDVARVTELEAAGFRVVDVNVTFRHTGAPPAVSYTGAVRDAEPPDRDDVLPIAAHDYTVSRFHLDPGIPPDVASRIKRDWVENFFLGGRGDRLLVAADTTGVVGFLLVLDSGDEPVIDLIAVSAAARGSGAGSAMVAELIASSPDRRVVVGSQVSNVSALRFYERLGFTVTQTQFVLHRHAA